MTKIESASKPTTTVTQFFTFNQRFGGFWGNFGKILEKASEKSLSNIQKIVIQKNILTGDL